MNPRNNLRYMETEHRIEEAVMKLLKDYDIKQINVRMICREADIHHTTFYNHYMDLEQLLESLMKSKSNALIELCLDATQKRQGDISILEMIKIVLNHVYDNRMFYVCYIDGLGSDAIDKHFDMAWNVMVDRLSIVGADLHSEVPMIRYSFSYSRAGFLQVMSDWLKANCTETPAEMTEIIYNAMIYGCSADPRLLAVYESGRLQSKNLNYD